jgi:uncharacterized DUF497 family protein
MILTLDKTIFNLDDLQMIADTSDKQENCNRNKVSNIMYNNRARTVVFNATLNNISLISWRSVGGGNRNTRKEPLTCRKSLTNFIT